MRTARVWKLLGIAGVAGVAATGVAVARDQRRRSTLAPEEVRARLHERLDRSGGGDGAPSVSPVNR